MPPTVTPRLIVEDAAAALAWYTEVLGAKELERYAMPDGFIVHSAIDIGGSVVSVIDEKPDWGNVSPVELNGSPVMMHVLVDDADAVGAKMVENGAEVIIAIADQFYGHREGRLRDPFGHLWIVSQLLRKMSDEEIQAGLDAFGS